MGARYHGAYLSHFLGEARASASGIVLAWQNDDGSFPEYPPACKQEGSSTGVSWASTLHTSARSTEGSSTDVSCASALDIGFAQPPPGRPPDHSAGYNYHTGGPLKREAIPLKREVIQ